MTIEIQNPHLSVNIHPKGAELQSIFGKETLIEYLWQGDEAFWAKRSPVLFPIVGGLRNNRYQLNGQEYHLMRHGFARDQDFALVACTAHSATFALESNEASRKVFPFDFRLEIEYSVEGNTLTANYRVHNVGDSDMLFSLGAHPAFNVPLTPGTHFNDYQLVFERQEPLQRWLLDDGGQLSGQQMAVPAEGRILPLTQELFAKDALVFKQLQSEKMTLNSPLHSHGLTMEFAGWPFFGIWSKPGPFVCLEPWCGIADNSAGQADLSEKEGIIRLAPKAGWERSWRITLF